MSESRKFVEEVNSDMAVHEKPGEALSDREV